MKDINKTPPNLCADPKTCCGCSACVSACPVQAITMQPDKNGFPRPVINEALCLHCGKCLRTCAFKKDSASVDPEVPMQIYALRSKDTRVVENSSSGGAFTAISDHILRQGGAIASAVYDYPSQSLQYCLYTDLQTRDKARGSKYIHPILGDIYDQCIQWMRDNPDKPLLFVGTGCHVAGFHEILTQRKLRSQAILVDLICHGTPSPKLWNDYVAYLEHLHGGRGSYVTFKDKRNGWQDPFAFIRIGEKEIPLTHYSYWFYENYSQRDSCFHCPYTKLHRNADLTIGDFWGIELVFPKFFSKRGNSLVFVQTQAGKDLFSCIQDTVDFVECSAADCMQPRLESPGLPNPKRDRFWQDYQRKGISYLIKHYHEDGKVKALFKKLAQKGKRFLRRLLPK